MIWVVWAMLGKRRAGTDSPTLALYDMALKFAAAGDLVYFCLPAYALRPGEFPPNARIRFVAVDSAPTFAGDTGVVPGRMVELFSRIYGRFPVDLVLTTRLLSVPSLKEALGDTLYDVPVILWEPGMEDNVNRKKMPYLRRGFAYGLSEAYPVFLTTNELRIAREFVGAEIGGSAVTRLDARAVVAAVGMRTQQLDAAVASAVKSETFTVLFGGRLNAVKQVSVLSQAVDMVYRSGRKMRFLVTIPGGFSPRARGYLPREILENEYVEVVLSCPRDRYYQLASSCHVGVSASKWEGFAVGFWEQLYMGLVVLFPDRPWVTSVLPDWYPGIYPLSGGKEWKSIYATLADVYDNYAAWVEKCRFHEMREYMKAKFGENQVANLVRTCGLNAVAERPARTFGDMDAVIADAVAAMPASFTIEELAERLETVSRVFVVDPVLRSRSYRMPSNYELYRFLLDAGCDLTGFAGNSVVLTKEAQ